MAKPKGLGKGLEALFIENNISDEENINKAVSTLRISQVEPDASQPRKFFDEEKLVELTASVKQHGVISPILVKLNDNERYTIIAGERRWRAARRAGLSEIPVIIMQIDEKQTREIALIENLQREDLNVVEEAKGYKHLMDSYEMTQEEISQVVGKSRPSIANALRLLALDAEILMMLQDGQITTGHAKALLSVDDREKQIELANEVIKKEMSVRELEKMVSKKQQPPKGKQLNIDDSAYLDLEKAIADNLGRRVKIIKGASKGRIELEYYSIDDLEGLCEFLSTGQKK